MKSLTVKIFLSLSVSAMLFSTMSSVFAGAKNISPKKIVFAICSKANTPCAKNDFSKRLMLNASDIQCIQPSIQVDNQKITLIVLGEKPLPNPNYARKSYSIEINFTKSAGNKLISFTRNNIGSAMQITIDGKELNRATIQSPLGNHFQIMVLNKKVSKKIQSQLNAKLCYPVQQALTQKAMRDLMVSKNIMQKFYKHPSYADFIQITMTGSKYQINNKNLHVFTVMVLSKHSDYLQRLSDDFNTFSDHEKYIIYHALLALGKQNIVNFVNQNYLAAAIVNFPNPQKIKNISLSNAQLDSMFYSNLETLLTAFYATGEQCYLHKLTAYIDDHSEILKNGLACSESIKNKKGLNAVSKAKTLQKCLAKIYPHDNEQVRDRKIRRVFVVARIVRQDFR